jgi:diaminohydroxyphosphoribosylaminopyrimidine deaminase/5-amino-6-(5-phosphoribosylamino)uracil reductase
MAGAVIVRDRQVRGAGFQRRAGGASAVTQALSSAGNATQGATLYTTIEPEAEPLIQAGIRRVVCAMLHPDSTQAGIGIARLQLAGIETEVGVGEAEARQLNRTWLTWKQTGRPFVILKWAMTLDGKIACASGDSRWVTGDTAREHLHSIRDQVDAILVGENTARRDDPELTARPKAPGALPAWCGGMDPGPDPDWMPKDPLRVLVDSVIRTDTKTRLFAPELHQERPIPNKTLVATTAIASSIKVQAIKAGGNDVAIMPEKDGQVSLAPLLDELGRRGVTSLLVEGGARIHWSFLNQGLADYLMVYVAPKVIGGTGAPGPVAGTGLMQMAAAWQTGPLAVTPIGEDVLLQGELRRS